MRFAVNEVRGLSPLYEKLALHVAGNDRVLTFLAELPADRQQPNLFFAAVRHVAGLPTDAHGLETILASQAPAIAQVMKSRTTQTNEPGRCAVLLPALARLPQPLAILEVGASAGLCLLADRYGYDYGRRRIEAPHDRRALAPVFPCKANDLTPLPTKQPNIGWRLGIDLNPLSVASMEQMGWLETLVWPEQIERLTRLRSAIEIAQQSPPRVLQGDLLRDLRSALAAVPAGMTPVVLHTAVLAYVQSQTERDSFADAVKASGAAWICNEAPVVFPWIAAKAPHPHQPNRYLLAIDAKPVAWTAANGQAIDWFAS